MKTKTRGRAKRTALSVRSAHRIVSIFTLMFMLASLLAPIASQTAFAQDATPPVSGDQTIVVQPAEQPAAPVSEEPAAPVVEEPAAPVVEEPAAPVVEEPAAPVVEEPAAPASEEQAAPAVEAPADETIPVDTVVNTNEIIVADASAASCAEANATSPTIGSDLPEYQSGSLVTLTGSGWVPGQTVDIFVDDDNLQAVKWSLTDTTIADAQGNIYYQFYLPDWFVQDYKVVATGECSTATTTFVDPEASWIEFNQFPTSASIGGTYTVQATSYFYDNVKGSKVKTPTGEPVTFSTNDSAICTVVGTSLSITGAGKCIVTASQAATKKFFGSSETAEITINQQGQTISFDTLAPVTYGGAAFKLTATASSGLPVAYSVTAGACTIDADNYVTFGDAGSCEITADQAGNTNYSAAASVSQTLTINQQGQTISFDTLGNKTVGDAQFTVSATGGGSGNLVTFTATGACTVTSAGLVTISGAGICTITADQLGNTNYSAAASVSQPFTIAQAATCALKVTYEGAMTTRPIVKSGSVVPVKVFITDCNNKPVTGLAPKVVVTLASGSAPSGDVTSVAAAGSSDSNGNMRDIGGGYYIYNMSTKDATSFPDVTATYKVWVVVNGVSIPTVSPSAEIGLKK